MIITPSERCYRRIVNSYALITVGRHFRQKYWDKKLASRYFYAYLRETGFKPCTLKACEVLNGLHRDLHKEYQNNIRAHPHL